MSSASENNKRIAKNTVLLYVRMGVTMLISLYTSRVVLETLGVEDFGIYNVVGGVVAMFSMLSGSLSAAISRFMTFELGKGDGEKLHRVFCTGINIQIIVSIIIVLLSETVGLWFLNTQVDIPADRIGAANAVFHCSVLTFVLSLLNVPYIGAITAHEKMSAFAYIGILDVFSKLCVAFALRFATVDKLKLYAFLLFLTAFSIRIIYGVYCKRHFAECKYKFALDMPLLKEMGAFAGWNFLGSGAYILNTQGINVLMNIYFGVVVNAAQGVAAQVQHAMLAFVTSFTTAVNPQIIKSYAQQEFDYMHDLVCRSAKFSAFLMLFMSVPIVLEADTVLAIWLKMPPADAATFVRWSVAAVFVDNVLANSLVTSMFATGKIKRYQITVTIVGGLVFPLSWLFFALGAEPYMGYVVYFVMYSILLYVRLYLLRSMIKLPIMMYVKKVLFKVISVAAVTFGSTGLLLLMDSGIVRLVSVCIVGSCVLAGAIYAIGLNERERKFVMSKLAVIIGKIRR